MSAPALYLAEDENLANTRIAVISELGAGIAALNRAEAHVQALLQVDREFYDGRDGGDINTHIDAAVRASRAAYAVLHMIADKERP